MNAVFIHIPRTAGISIEKSLNLKRYTKDLVVGEEYEGLITFNHYPMKYVIELGKFDTNGRFFFTFVRNPFDRCVSLWKFAQKTKYFHGTFAEFVRAIPDMHLSYRMRQYEWLQDVTVEFVGRFENLEYYFKLIRIILGVGPVELQHLNATEHKPFLDYYDIETAKAVSRYYGRDFEEFGYMEELYDYL